MEVQIVGRQFSTYIPPSPPDATLDNAKACRFSGSLKTLKQRTHFRGTFTGHSPALAHVVPLYGHPILWQRVPQVLRARCKLGTTAAQLNSEGEKQVWEKSCRWILILIPTLTVVIIIIIIIISGSGTRPPTAHGATRIKYFYLSLYVNSGSARGGRVQMLWYCNFHHASSHPWMMGVVVH